MAESIYEAEKKDKNTPPAEIFINNDFFKEKGPFRTKEKASNKVKGFKK